MRDPRVTILPGSPSHVLERLCRRMASGGQRGTVASGSPDPDACNQRPVKFRARKCVVGRVFGERANSTIPISTQLSVVAVLYTDALA